MTTDTRRCVLCHHIVESQKPEPIPLTTSTRCSVFVDKCESMFNEMWAWVAVGRDTPLEGLCGLVIDNVPHRAISTDFIGALKLIPFLDQAAKKTGQQFKLVRFTKAETKIRI